MRWRAILPAAALLATACGTVPADPDGTSERIRASGVLRVGMAGDAPAARRLVAEVAQAARARALVTPSTLEPMLIALERGELDLVVAPVAPDTPWKTRVAFAPPISATGDGDRRIELRAAMRNGENRWIMLVEGASRRVAADYGQ